MSEIEFRWYLSNQFKAGSINAGSPDEWARLQVREREGPRGEGWWGEWKDIPVEDARG